MAGVASGATPLPPSVTAGQLAQALGVSERVINGRKGDGRLPRAENGQIPLRPILEAGIKALAAQQRGADPDGPDLEGERARLAKAQADAQEMKNDLLRQNLIPREDVVAGVQVVIANARAKLVGLPTKAAPLLVGLAAPAQVRDVLAEIVREALDELASTEVVPADGPADGVGDDGGDAAMGPAAATDGERVGRPVPPAKPRGKRRAR